MSDEGARQDENAEFHEADYPEPRKNAGLMVFVGALVLGIAIYFGIAQGFAALLMFPGIPLVLLWFVYWFFLRRLIRMRRIRGARERRLMREAARRETNSDKSRL